MTMWDDEIDWYALSNGIPTVMPDGTLVNNEPEETMRDDQTDTIVIGSIVQIVPSYERDNIVEAPVGAGELLVVTEKESWGVIGYRPNGEIIRRPWNMIEPTGGKIAFDRTGKKLIEEPTRKHHP